ncbi:MAG TPA: ferrochelatase [Isosphaeraceae bacterium]|jgi:ferrochelatase|nr:ferrochelatase [Isosphaeraceae bacterium]
MDSPLDSVLLLAYGGPESMGEVRPFLDTILRGLPVPRERHEAVVHHYELIGGRSPLNELTERQASGLRAILEAEGPALPVYVGMRFAEPSIAATLRDMARDGRCRAVAIVLSPYRSGPSFDKYREAVAKGCEELDDAAPRVEFVEPWFDHPLFAEAQADQVRRAFETIPADRRDSAALVFSAHSIPTAVADRSPYVGQIRAACEAVAHRLDDRPWRLAWQSRSGEPRTPWLEPDINDELRTLHAEGVRDVVVCPIGFVADHVEVLYDLDIEAAQTCRDLGLTMVRAESVNDHPTFIRALADLVKKTFATEGTAGEKNDLPSAI